MKAETPFFKGGRAWLWLAGVTLAGILIPFLFWGARFDAVFSLEGARRWMEGFGAWAGLAGVLLLVADLVLPVPSTVVMSAMGLVFGPFWGGLLAGLGSALSGALGYGLSRCLGRPVAERIAGAENLRRGEVLIRERGVWLVLGSRWMPVLPEAVACLAGLARMEPGRFFGALICGSLPTGFVFAWVGAVGVSWPGWSAGLSVGLPCVLWVGARGWMRHRGC